MAGIAPNAPRRFVCKVSRTSFGRSRSQLASTTVRLTSFSPQTSTNFSHNPDGWTVLTHSHVAGAVFGAAGSGYAAASHLPPYGTVVWIERYK